MTRKYTTPYSNILPPLSSAEKDSLKQRIADEGGVHDPALLTEDGELLDGHNRLEIAPKQVEFKVIKGSGDWSVAQRKAFVIRCNRGRRNLSGSQEQAIEGTSKKLARDLKGEGKTQKQIAGIFGVSQQRVSQWLGGNKENKGACNPYTNPPRLDCRVKVPSEMKPVIAARVAAGESQSQIAADFGITQPLVSQIATKEQKQAAKAEERKAAVKKLGGDLVGVHHGDFREVGKVVADGSVDFIFTDPPYDSDAVKLYGDLAEFAARVLKPGAWCLAYSGQAFLPEVLEVMSRHLEYGWTFGIGHSGGDIRFRKFKLHNGWKPIVGFYKPPLDVWWEWFTDFVSGGKEKDDHEWQQSEFEAMHYVESMAPDGGIICDPFCGSGTTCAAAKRLGRQWIAFDSDLAAVETARGRLA